MKCQAHNAGGPSVDGVAFADIEMIGVEKWIKGLQKQLHTKAYKPSPVKRKN